MRKCEHKTAFAVWLGDNTTNAASFYTCVCGALGVRSLGPSNDSGEAVRIEILAAEIGQSPEVWARFMDLDAAIERGLRRVSGRDSTWVGLGATSPTAGHLDVNGGPNWTDGQLGDYLAGWLARDVSGDAGDAFTWPWDPSRPVAGQFEEWQRKAAAETERLYLADSPGADPATEIGCGAEGGYRLVAADPVTLVVGNATPSVWKDEISARDAEVAAFDAGNPPCDGCEAPFGCDPGRCYKAPGACQTHPTAGRHTDGDCAECHFERVTTPTDADDDEHHDADVDARFDVTDEVMLPDGEAR